MAKTAFRPLRVFEVLPIQPGERIVGPVPDEIQSLIARIDRLTEQVRGSGGGLLLFRDLVLVGLGEF
jgi:hypothetical protein